MPVEFSFLCPLPNGLHARPASHLAAVAGKFASACVLTNLRNRCQADLKSVLSMIAADIRLNDECRVHLHGVDEQPACAQLRRFVEQQLAAYDTLELDLNQEHKHLPRSLRSAGVKACPGRPVNQGIGLGQTVILRPAVLSAKLVSTTAANPASQQEQARRSVATLRSRMQEKIGRVSVVEAGLLRAHLAMLNDAALQNKILEQIAAGRSAAQAITDAGTFFSDLLRRSENPYLRERALDVQGICLELLQNISTRERTESTQLTAPSIVIAENLLPQQLLALNHDLVRGLALESAATTSHTVILARSLGFPTLVGVKDVFSGASQVAAGTAAIVDANRGFLFLHPTPLVQKFYEREANTFARRTANLARYAARPAVTSDGHTIEVAANVSSAREAARAFQTGADGIGVFRTEMLFLDREALPPEEEQFQIYAQTARAAHGKPVILRLLDVGGDKPLPSLNMQQEDNPALGLRGVRVFFEYPELLHTQLRAILRASALGRLWLLVPMVSTLEEVLWFKDQLRRVKEDLHARQIAFDASLPLGIMIEVPSVAFILDSLCREVDFFSLGTNDLIQYFFAADRGNGSVTSLSHPNHPAFLNFLRQIVAAVRQQKKWIGICGDMAADLRNLPLLIALELDEISVPSDIPAVKEHIAGLSFAACQKLLSEALGRERAAQVDGLLNSAAIYADQSLLDRELVLLRDQMDSKEEAIREMVEALYVAGRTDDPDLLEEALWTREAAYSTGMGHGFAVPHCKTDAVKTGSLAVLKLRKPVEWGSLDGNPVQMVILLAARASDSSNAHLRVFSKLARNLMDENFREQLLKADAQDNLLSVLSALTKE